MHIEPKIRGFICTTAHPLGCAAHVQEQIDHIKNQAFSATSSFYPKKVLVIGASTGYGLATRIVAAFAYRAETVGVFFERPADEKRTASAGWYNTAAFEKAAHAEKLYAKSINGDAFSQQIKHQTIELIKKDWQGQVDLVIYSLASPRRTHPDTGIVYNSVLKTIGTPFSNKNVDVFTGEIKNTSIEPANEKEIADTVAVMGGDDWQRWIDYLLAENLLAPGAKTLAYNYIGPQITYPIYHEGTIGQAKRHLEETAKKLTQRLAQQVGGEAYISVNKAVVTQASAAIPIVPLYISLLYRVMKTKQLHEGCIEQMYRLFSERLYAGIPVPLDAEGFIRLDDWEMREDIQEAIKILWQKIDSNNIEALADLEGYRHDFYRLFGFDMPHIDYRADVDPHVAIPSILLP